MSAADIRAPGRKSDWFTVMTDEPRSFQSRIEASGMPLRRAMPSSVSPRRTV